jgi:hypothetical protein
MDYPYKVTTVIYNNSGSAASPGRIETALKTIHNLAAQLNHIDYYINSPHSGYPNFIAHLDINKAYSWPPLMPLALGGDYMNPMALAALIEQSRDIHIIDDGESTIDWVSEALHLVKERKGNYWTPVIIHYLREKSESEVAYATKLFDKLLRECPVSEGFNVNMYFTPVREGFTSETPFWIR